MIGEIRDLETAQIAVQASLTGHLVFSTLHTNDAISAFTRLIDMGLEPFLVASALRGVLAQRLVRKLCPDCAAPIAAPAGEIADEFAACAPPALRRSPRWRHAAGCPNCLGRAIPAGGLRDDPADAALREAILQRPPTLRWNRPPVRFRRCVRTADWLWRPASPAPTRSFVSLARHPGLAGDSRSG